MYECTVPFSWKEVMYSNYNHVYTYRIISFRNSGCHVYTIFEMDYVFRNLYLPYIWSLSEICFIDNHNTISYFYVTYILSRQALTGNMSPYMPCIIVYIITIILYWSGLISTLLMFSFKGVWAHIPFLSNQSNCRIILDISIQYNIVTSHVCMSMIIECNTIILVMK